MKILVDEMPVYCESCPFSDWDAYRICKLDGDVCDLTDDCSDCRWLKEVKINE